MPDTEIFPKDKLIEKLERLAVSINSDCADILDLERSDLAAFNIQVRAKFRVVYGFMFESERLISEALKLISESKE